MIILGIAFSHNGSVSLIKDGKIIVAIQAERLTRVKRQSIDMDKNLFALEKCLNYCLTSAGLTINDIDCAAISTPWKIEKFKEFDNWINQKTTKKNIIVKSVSHHLAHAEYVTHFGENINGLICISDGSGSYGDDHSAIDLKDTSDDDLQLNSKGLSQTKETISIYKYNDKKIIPKFKIFSANTEIIKFQNTPPSSFFHSVGHVWEIASQIIFKERNQAGKVMGLLGYNKNNIDIKFLDFDESLQPVIKAETINKEIEIIKNKKYSEITDLAYISDIVQNNTNEYLSALIKEFINIDDKAIYLSGGVMLNIKLNSYISDIYPDKEIISIGSNEDNGTAIGAALCVFRNIFNLNNTEKPNDFFGKEYNDTEIIEALKSNNMKFKKFEKEQLAREIANKIAQSKIVMLSYGKSEFGPRALSHRSILANATDPDTKPRLDREIKMRETFRPYAPIVLEEDYKDYFSLNSVSPFMLFDAKVLDKRLPAITHIDNTSRPQTISKSDGISYEILKNLKKISGFSVCLNTSLNRPGEPICESPLDAVNYAINSKADYLVINNFFIELNQS